jgi:molybdopterin-containing oxidoreductase family iron-sulfur binding subunit
MMASSTIPKTYWLSPVDADEQGRSCRADGKEVDGDPDWITTRRGFLKAAGFSFAGALAASCSRAPAVSALPYVAQPEGFVPGRPVLYASTCGACDARCGVIVTTRDGRPLKIEGNPDHPLSGGSTCAIGQAAILGLYDSHRLSYPTRQGQRSSWADVDREIRQSLARIRAEGAAVRVLTPTVTSPTTAALIAAFLADFKNGRHVSYDAISASAILEAYTLTHGRRLVPRYRFDQADVVVSFDADFLGTWISPVEYTRGYSSRRKVDSRPAGAAAARLYHVQVESRLSLTGTNADERLRSAPGEIGHLATHLAARLARRAGAQLATDGLIPSPSEPALDRIADRLWAARGRGLVVSASDDVRVQVLCNDINQLIGAYGATLDLDRPSYQRQGDDRELTRLRGELARGEISALIVAGANPIYDLADDSLANDLRRVPLVVSTSERMDETAALAHFVCPDRHALESWSDAEPVAGIVSLVQPTIQLQSDARPIVESLFAWTTGRTDSALNLVRAHWQREIHPRAESSEPFDLFWNKTLERGAAEVRPRQPQAASAGRFDASATRTVLRPDAPPTGALALVLYPSLGMLDGRHAHNAWLHEMPDPVTKVTWDNYACLSPQTARRLDIADGDIVRVAAVDGKASLEIPAFVQPGQHDSVVAIALGYGRSGTDRFARVGPPWFSARLPEGLVGVNAASFAASDGRRVYGGRSVTLVKTGRTHLLASTQSYHSLAVGEGGAERPIVQELTLAELGDAAERSTREAPEGDLWPADHQYPGHRWGMAVDLDACTGCSACVVACQAENNVPVVGQDEVRRQRDMHWIRIDRYYSGGVDEPSVVHQPMMCQHCEHAPCETVCPVLATTHSDEGLNEQVYNRCVGTRYCANNCPYKVRRFNWFDYPHEDRLQNLVFNPNVTVRSRGVMEKCTMCVQRIEEGKIEARRTGRAIADGTIKTACQQVCPAEAIVFGDLNDPASRVAALVRNRRAYRVLEDLNTRPAVRYLKKVRNESRRPQRERGNG